MICCIAHLVLGLLILPFDDLKARFFAPVLSAFFRGLRKAIAPCLCCQIVREGFEKWLHEQELTVAEREEREEREKEGKKEKVGEMMIEEDEERHLSEMEMLVDAGKELEEDKLSNGEVNRGRIELQESW